MEKSIKKYTPVFEEFVTRNSDDQNSSQRAAERRAATYNDNDLVSFSSDVAIEHDEILAYMEEQGNKHGVAFQVIKAIGPGGGWPYMKIIGKFSNVKNYMVEYNEGSGVDMEDEMEGVEKFEF